MYINDNTITWIYFNNVLIFFNMASTTLSEVNFSTFWGLQKANIVNIRILLYIYIFIFIYLYLYIFRNLLLMGKPKKWNQK